MFAMLFTRPIAIVLLSAFLALTGKASAQTPPQSDAAKAMLGTWEISNADRDKICMVTFRPEPAPGGSKLEFDKTCPEVFALTKGVTAWTLGARDALRLVDAKGKTILELTEVESGMFEGERPGEGLYFLQNLAAAGTVWRTAEQMFGDWAVTRGADKPICTITLSKVTVADGFTLKLKPGCDALVSSFNPSSWRMDRGELVLSARTGAWRFEEGDPATTWHRIPESVEPLLLVRQ
ncbi:MAG: hypothetical protein QOD40_2511 [Alphaproteobacteria bacterium]|jgi:hypothetical protein|nr:hypothetical protein [Alphaproteobacteria bacterium]